jgi:hypothetical protein
MTMNSFLLQDQTIRLGNQDLVRIALPSTVKMVLKIDQRLIFNRQGKSIDKLQFQLRQDNSFYQNLKKTINGKNLTALVKVKQIKGKKRSKKTSYHSFQHHQTTMKNSFLLQDQTIRMENQDLVRIPLPYTVKMVLKIDQPLPIKDLYHLETMMRAIATLTHRQALLKATLFLM